MKIPSEGSARLVLAFCLFSFSFTNNVGMLCGVLATTNLALPLAGWSVLGAATEVSPGRFQFADPQATNSPFRFYRACSP